MKGIELSENFYLSCIKPVLHTEFPEYEKRIAVGLVGQGSECFGFDDEYSRDHDFGKRLCLWITKEDDEKIGFSLMNAYSDIAKTISENADDRSGIFTIEDFYLQLIGHKAAPSTWQQWFFIPEHALATAVNGKVFRDDLGKFSAIRSDLSAGFPRDVLLKKISAHLALMAQAGQYNFVRCQKRQENGAAVLALYQFVDHALHVLFLLNNRYTPFYKWRFRSAKKLPTASDLAYQLEELILNVPFNEKVEGIEQIANRITIELNRKGLSSSNCSFLEVQAKEIVRQIATVPLRKMHIMEYGSD